MELVAVLLLAAVFIGPTAYHLYERLRRRKKGEAPEEAKKGPSYGRHMLGMLAPVFLLLVFLILIAVGLQLATR